MKPQKYNQDAAAVVYEIINHCQDIGNWTFVYKDIVKNGLGFENLMIAANEMGPDMNVVYVKRLNYLIPISQNFIDYTNPEFSASAKMNFFWIRVAPNIEFRNWDNFESKLEDPVQFLERLEIYRTCFRKGLKNRLTIENHYTYTKAKDQWDDICKKYYLNSSSNCRALTQALLPQNNKEWDDMQKLDKAGFYYANPDYFGKIVPNVHQYDIRNAYLSYFIRGTFPYEPFTYTDDKELINKVISEGFYCYYGKFRFKGLRYRTNFKIDLSRFGTRISKLINNNWDLWLTSIDIAWFNECFDYDEWEPIDFYYTKHRGLPKDYVEMCQDLFDFKNQQDKETFAREIGKFRCELPYGQGIKQVEHHRELKFSEDIKEFLITQAAPMSLEQIQHKLMNRGMPYYVSLWIVAYSRYEFFTMGNKIGFDKVMYGDTDSVKFIGEEGIEVVQKRNKEIRKQVEKIADLKKMYIEPIIGEWKNEGDLQYFKAIGIKWYLTKNLKGELDVKAAGANIEALKEWINKQDKPFIKFSKVMEVPYLFHRYGYSDICDYAVYEKWINFIDKGTEEDIQGRYTELTYYKNKKNKEAI